MIFNEQTNTYKIEPMVIDGSPMSYEVKAYKIWYEDEPNNIYVGSTKRPLSERMGDHRKKVRQGRTSRIYNLMREKGVNDFKYVLLGTGRVSNFEQQRMFEEMWIKKLKPPLNSYRAFATEEEHREKRQEYMKVYNQKEEAKQKKKEYKNKLEYKEQQKEYRHRPEVKERHKEYMKEHNQTAEAKQKKRDYEKKRHRICMCGSGFVLTPSGVKKHRNTKKHKLFMRNFELELMKSK